MRKILVPGDFSEGSRLALRYAAPLARRLGAAVTLLYVDSKLLFATELRSNVLALSDDEADAAFARELTELAVREMSAAFPVETVVRRGKAGTEIVAAAGELTMDLILMPTHGYTGLKRTFFGSTADHVVRHALCPVCTIRNEVFAETAKATFTRGSRRSILVPVDFSECSRQALRFAGAIARQTGGSLSLLHVIERKERSEGHVPSAGERQAEAEANWRAKEVLALWIKSEVPATVRAGRLIRVGVDPLEHIEGRLRVGDRNPIVIGTQDYSLIVIGTHEYSWMRRVFEGGDTERVMRLAPCAVITVRPARPAPTALHDLED